MWFISRKTHNKKLKIKENYIQELTRKIGKLEKLLQEERRTSEYLKEKRDNMTEKYIFEANNNIRNAKNVIELEKIINKIEYKTKGKRTMNAEATMQIKKLVKDYHTHN